MVRIAVGDVMTRDFVSVSPESSLLECAKKMVRERVNSMIICKDKKLYGIMTSRDLLWTITKKKGIDLSKIRTIEIATKKVAVIKPSADILEALEKMKSLNFRRLPVLSKGELIGVITLKDILRIAPSLYAEIGELIDIREETRKLTRAKSSWPIEGLCNECGSFSELTKIQGKYLCPDCRADLV